MKLRRIFSRPESLVFFFTAVVMGVGFGLIESYLFLFLKELGASDMLLGKEGEMARNPPPTPILALAGGIRYAARQGGTRMALRHTLAFPHSPRGYVDLDSKPLKPQIPSRTLPAGLTLTVTCASEIPFFRFQVSFPSLPFPAAAKPVLQQATCVRLSP